MSQDKPKSRKVVLSKTVELVNLAGEIVESVEWTQPDYLCWRAKQKTLTSYPRYVPTRVSSNPISDVSILVLILCIEFMAKIVKRVAENYRLNCQSSGNIAYIVT